MNITIQLGIKEEHREQAAELFALAFQKKFINLIGHPPQIIGFFKDKIVLNQAITAINQFGELVGLAGFQIGKIPLINIKYIHFIEYFGIIKGIYKFSLMYLIFYRKQDNKKQLLLNGIIVKDMYRGQGIGQKMIYELELLAKKNNLNTIKLDVIDENPKAKKLYESLGFRDVKHLKVPSFISKLINVKGVTTMVKQLK